MCWVFVCSYAVDVGPHFMFLCLYTSGLGYSSPSANIVHVDKPSSKPQCGEKCLTYSLCCSLESDPSLPTPPVCLKLVLPDTAWWKQIGLAFGNADWTQGPPDLDWDHSEQKSWSLPHPPARFPIQIRGSLLGFSFSFHPENCTQGQKYTAKAMHFIYYSYIKLLVSGTINGWTGPAYKICLSILSSIFIAIPHLNVTHKM